MATKWHWSNPAKRDSERAVLNKFDVFDGVKNEKDGAPVDTRCKPYCKDNYSTRSGLFV